MFPAPGGANFTPNPTNPQIFAILIPKKPTALPATVSHRIPSFPFGEEMAAQHAGGDYATRYKFNGKELDPQTGYYYYGARYYDPVVSRWLSIDPLAEKYPGLSPYNYTANNPVMLVDPDGRETVRNEESDDIIYIGNDGKVSRVVETDDPFNVFIMEETSQVLHLNDKNGLDIGRYTYDGFLKGDRIFFPISDTELKRALNEAGKGSWYNLIIKSYGSADFTLSYLVRNYFGKDGTGSEHIYLEDGILRTHYEENHHYFKFGDDNRLFNLYDAGNFMWGAWMNFSGFEYITAKIGSQLNELFNDTNADQRAIRAGYHHYNKIKN